MENVLRRFHLLKEPRDSEARLQLRKELFAYNTVSKPLISSERRLASATSRTYGTFYLINAEKMCAVCSYLFHHALTSQMFRFNVFFKI